MQWHCQLLVFLTCNQMNQSLENQLEDNGTAAMLVPNSKVNEIRLLKRDQHGRRPHHCKSRINYAIQWQYYSQ